VGLAFPGCRPPPANRVLRQRLVQATQGAEWKKNTCLAAQHHCVAARCGKERASVSLACSILMIAYPIILSRRKWYGGLGGDYFDKRRHESLGNQLLRRPAKLGHQTTLGTRTAAVSAATWFMTLFP
jgi:hypothetical protein